MTQYLRPISDTFANGWTPSSGSDMYPMLDETTASSTDYVSSPDNPTSAEQAEERLTSGTDPVSSTGHIVGIGLQAINGDTLFDCDLVQGTTVLDSWTESVTVAAGHVTRSRTLTSTVTNSITDYTDLRVRWAAKPASATTYYVAAAGSNSANGLTPGTAWQTSSKVEAVANAGTLVAGDQVLFKRGETFGDLNLYAGACNGAAGNPIIFGAYGEGARPILSGGGSASWALATRDCTYLTFENLQLTGGTDYGLRAVCNATHITHIRFNRCKAYSNAGHGFYCEGSTPYFLNDITFTDCESDRNGKAGYYVVNNSTSATGVHYYKCKATYNGQIDPFGSHGFSITNSINVGWHYCEAALTNIDPSTGLPNAFVFGEGIGFAMDDHADSTTCEYCYSHDNAGPGVQASHQGDDNITMYCLIVNNLGSGVSVNGNPGTSNNTYLYNNTICDNGGFAGLDATSGPIVVLEIKNNIFANNAGYGVAFGGSSVTGGVVATNVFYGNGSGATINVSGATGSITSDPTLNADYTLIVGSPAINAGLTLGSTWDDGLKPGAVWPLAVNTVDQDSYSSWEIGAYVYI